MRFARHFLVAAVGAMTVFVAVPAAAHATLVKSTPAANSQGGSPQTISLSFSEKVVPAFSGLELVTPAGRTLVIKAKVGKDGKSLSGAAPARLPPGVYKLNWRIASVDGHRMTGGFTFKIG